MQRIRYDGEENEILLMRTRILLLLRQHLQLRLQRLIPPARYAGPSAGDLR
ncbi:unnamed protein product [[Actinomadura] parvosata subsp. kistnae]|nr:unnamed protein product [Actinomadura parvosata subsp. kistnae]